MKKYIHPRLFKTKFVLSDGSLFEESRTIQTKQLYQISDLDYLVHPSWFFTRNKHLLVRRTSSGQLERFKNRYKRVYI